MTPAEEITVTLVRVIEMGLMFSIHGRWNK